MCASSAAQGSIFFSGPTLSAKKMLLHTQWTLVGLRQRPELNGSAVTAIEEIDGETQRVRVKIDNSNTHLRVCPHNLRSRVDPGVDAVKFAEAFQAMRSRRGDDANLSAFIKRWESGDFDGALSAAGTFSLSQCRAP